MKSCFFLPSTLHTARLSEPVTRDTTDAQNNLGQQSSPSPDLRPVNINPRGHSPAWLQKLFAKEKKSGASTSLSSHSIFSSPDLQKKFTEIERQVIEAINEKLSKHDRDTFPTFVFKKLMEECVNNGLEAFDQEIIPFQENATDGKPHKELQSSGLLAKAKVRLQEVVEETSLAAGWKVFQPEKSKLKWESPDGPLLIKRELTLQQVTLKREDIASGNYGSVSIFENENGDKLIGKTLNNWRQCERGGSARDDLGEELKGYEAIYRAVGPHPNLVNVYGIARVRKNNKEIKHGLLDGCGAIQAQKNSRMERVLLMDMVPGSTGEKTFEALRKCWNAGKISSEQYWGAVQFIGRRLLDVTEHFGKAGVVHNDIKPKNFMVNQETGEPVVIDLGTWTKSGERIGKGTMLFMAPEVMTGTNSGERSDVFSVGVSLQDGIEEDRVKKLRKDLDKLQIKLRLAQCGKEKSLIEALKKEIRELAALHGLEENREEDDVYVKQLKEGLHEQAAFKDDEGNMVRTPGTYSAKTAYTRFVSKLLAVNRDNRVNSEEAKELEFLSDSMLGDDAAKDVIKKVIALATEEEQKPENEQWKRAEPQVRLGNEERNLQGNAQDAANSAALFIKSASWVDVFKQMAETVKIQSGEG